VALLLLLFSFSCSKKAKQVEKVTTRKVYVFKKGDKPSTVLRKLIANKKEEKEALLALEKFIDVRKIRPGDSLVVSFERDSLVESLEFFSGDLQGVKIFREDKGWISEPVPRVLVRRLALIEGVITSNLYESMLESGASPKLIQKFVNLFAWQIDFNTECRKGDTFGLLVESFQIGEKEIKGEKIFAAFYKGKVTGRRWAFYFSNNGKSGYFDENGNSLRRPFLRSPLPFTRITSRYSLRRLHPILRIRRPHFGIDYAAPRGTPVRAIGEGRILYAGWKGELGRYVAIKHANGYISGYGHLYRIRRGIRVGKKVNQGEVIGWVGSSGLATGPHLHFEIRKNGKYINPLSLKPPPTFSLKSEELTRFFWEKEKAVRLIELIDEKNRTTYNKLAERKEE